MSGMKIRVEQVDCTEFATPLLVLNVFAPRVGKDREHTVVHRDRDGDGVDDRHEHRAPVVDRDRDGVDDREERPVARR